MSSPTPPSSNGNGSGSSFQRVAIAAGTLIVVLLTVVIALFLAAQDFGQPTPPAQTPVVVASPTTPGVTIDTPTIPVLPPAATSSPTDLPTATPTPTDTPEPTVPPPPPPTDTDTPVPPPPAETATPVVIIVTATPLPGATTSATGPCQPPPNWVAYVAQSGDTLDSLASRVGSSVFELQQVNCLPSVNLRTGQSVYLPSIPPTPTETRTPGPTPRPGNTPTVSPTPIVPVINDVVPDQVDKNTADEQEVVITVLGRNFDSRATGFRVELRGPETRTLELSEARSDTSFDAIVPRGLPEGFYDVVVTNPNTNRAGVKEDAYHIGPPPPTSTPCTSPEIESFSPTTGKVSEQVPIDIVMNRERFDRNDTEIKVRLRKGSIEKTFIPDREDITENTIRIIIPPLPETGEYDLLVLNSCGTAQAETRYRADP